MFSSELPGGFPQCWIAHLWIEVWPLESDGKQSEADRRGKACIASPRQIRKKPVPGTRGSRTDRTSEFCPIYAKPSNPIEFCLNRPPEQSWLRLDRRILLFDSIIRRKVACIFISFIRKTILIKSQAERQRPGAASGKNGQILIKISELKRSSLQ